MDAQARTVIRECTLASDQERISFPEVIGKLTAVGLERYHADLIRHEKVYYMPDGASEVVPCIPLVASPAEGFSAAVVEAAVHAIQRREIAYLEFCARIAAGGCVGYFVSLAGRRAIYYGRTGDSHIEWFPGAK
ncbi:MAG: DUF1398 family protein [Rhizobiaceae bacterium]|nr:DUF1398 family protein [Rhizobiaceae bacterium]